MILIITKLQDKFVDSFKQGSGRLKSAFSLANRDIYPIGTCLIRRLGRHVTGHVTCPIIQIWTV